jgi:hypothetical protein
MTAVPGGPGNLDIEELITRIRRQREESEKFSAETRKLVAESLKLEAERRKIDRDRRFSPLVAIAAGLAALFTALGAFTAGFAAVWKMLH